MAASMWTSLRKATNLRNSLCWFKRGQLACYATEVNDIWTKKSDTNNTNESKHRRNNVQTNETSFATMFRNSVFAQLGDLKDKRVTGTIEAVRGDDLYIDFGGKFQCVCARPARNAEFYKKGTSVRLILNDIEMTSSFLGSEKHITLLEADCTLVGLQSLPKRTFKPMDRTRERNRTEENSKATSSEKADVSASGETINQNAEASEIKMEQTVSSIPSVDIGTEQPTANATDEQLSSDKTPAQSNEK